MLNRSQMNRARGVVNSYILALAESVRERDSAAAWCRIEQIDAMLDLLHNIDALDEKDRAAWRVAVDRHRERLNTWKAEQ
jgi:hypothetical protein